jgi:predicted RNA-binding protein with PUA-like domain
MQYWLVKSEPFKYSWEQLVKDKVTDWTGVRNYAARNNLKAMKKGDLVFFYHSNEGLDIVGIAKVLKEHYQDPTTKEEAWVAVDLGPHKVFKKPVSLEAIKKNAKLKGMELLRIARLSVSKVSEDQFNEIVKMSQE